MAEKDNVATALCDILPGDRVCVYEADQSIALTLEARTRVPYGNKLALSDFKEGDLVFKYGESVGIVCRDIISGALVHVHNVRSLHLNIPDTIIAEIVKEMKIEE